MFNEGKNNVVHKWKFSRVSADLGNIVVKKIPGKEFPRDCMYY